jgi:hypothetical protein
MSSLSKEEIKALAMHELMKREQQEYADRIAEQRKVALMSDESLKEIVYGKDHGYIKTNKERM